MKGMFGMSTQIARNVGVAAVSFCLGFTLGMYFAKMRLEKVYQDDFLALKNGYEAGRRPVKTPTTVTYMSNEDLEAAQEIEISAGLSKEYAGDEDKEVDHITETEFEKDFEDFDKTFLYYYRMDDVVCDDNDQVLDESDIEAMIGNDFRIRLERHTMCYIRNFGLEVDYSIRGLSKDFASDVAGRVETQKEKINRQSTRRIMGSGDSDIDDSDDSDEEYTEYLEEEE